MKLALRITVAVMLVLLAALVGIVIHANLKIARDEVLSAEADAPGRFYSIDGHKWHVLTVGDVKADASGAPILLIHGFSSAGLVTWQPWANKLAAQRALIMPDILGYGHSEHITVPGPYYTLKSYAASLAAILDRLGVAQVDVVGHSYGGGIAAQFALDFPARVRRIVFIDAVTYEFEPTAIDSIIQWPFGIGRAVTWHLTAGGPRSLSSRFCRSQANEQCARLLKIADTTETMQAMMYANRHSADAKNLSMNLTKITAPSLVIWGTNDPLVPAKFGERLARETRAELVLVERGFHMPFRYQPDLVAKRVLDFLAPR